MWAATSAGLQVYAFFASKPLTPQNHSKSLLAPVGEILPSQSPLATVTFENSPPMQMWTLLSV